MTLRSRDGQPAGPRAGARGRGPHRFLRSAAALLLVVALPLVAAADEDPEVDALATITVMATRLGHLVRDEPVRVEVVPEEEIEENLTVQPGNLTTLLTELAGVQMQSTAPGLGGTTLRLRGMHGRHTLVLQDGLPLLGAQSDAFGLLQAPPLDLAHVEIIKGVGSALYGGSALGGVLNLVSRAPGSEPALLLNRSSRGSTDAVGFASEQTSSRLGYTVIASASDQSREDLDHDGWAELAGYRRYTLRPRLFWADESGALVFATTGFVDERRDGGTMTDRSLADGKIVRDALETQRLDVGAVSRVPLPGGRQWGTRWAATRLDRDRRFGAERVRDRQSTLYAETTLEGAAGLHKWLVGAAALYEGLATSDAPDANVHATTPAVFAQNEWSPSGTLTLSGSARLDANPVYGTFVSPRLSTMLRIDQAWSVRLSLGSGFDAPTPLVDEIQATSLARLEPLRGLHAERASSASLDVGWRVEGLEINASVFASHIDDPLTMRDSPNPGRLRLVNAEGPQRIVGAEFLVHYVLDDLHVIASSTLLDATECARIGGRQRADRVPRVTAEIAALVEEEGRGRFGLELSYTGTQRLDGNPYRDASRPYLELSALAELKVGRASIFANAINLTGVRQTRWDPLLRPTPVATGERLVGVWAPIAGRVFNIGVRAEL